MKARASKLDAHAERLQEWFLAGKTLTEAQGLLKAEGCSVSLGRLSEWWQARQAEIQEDAFLAQITSGAQQMKRFDEAFAKNPEPALNQIMARLKVLTALLSTQSIANPGALKQMDLLLGHLMDWEKVQVKRGDQALDERRVKLLEEKAKLADAAKGVMGDKALSEEQRAARMRELFGMCG